VQAVAAWRANVAQQPEAAPLEAPQQRQQRQPEQGTSEAAQQAQQAQQAAPDADGPGVQRQYVAGMKALAFTSAPLVASGGFYFRKELGAAQGARRGAAARPRAASLPACLPLQLLRCTVFLATPAP
jgi:hypothetical protein